MGPLILPYCTVTAKESSRDAQIANARLRLTRAGHIRIEHDLSDDDIAIILGLEEGRP